MDKRKKLILSYIIIFVIFLIIYKTVILKRYLLLENIYLSVFLMIFAFVLFKSFGLKKEINTQSRRRVFELLVIELTIYFIIIHTLGFFLGFTANALSYSIKNLIINILFPILIIITTEFIRYITIESFKDNKIIISVITILLIVLEIFTSINIYRFTDITEIYLFLTLSFLPAIVKNIMLSYLAYKVGYKITMFYRIVVELYPLIIPIYANLGNYLFCINAIILPFIVYISCYELMDKERKSVRIQEKRFYISDFILGGIAVLLFILISGVTDYKIVAIGSGSMEPIISKGDSVIIKEYDSFEDIKVGDIVSFRNNIGVNVVHRVDEIDNGLFITKGDSNNKQDDGKLRYTDIQGKVVLTIPYLGYPSVWISENSGGVK